MEWITLPGITEYTNGLEIMERRLTNVIEKKDCEAIYLLEHDHIYTAGTGYDDSELLDPGEIPVVYTGRGGKFTYHGPGQRVVYPIIDLKSPGRELDVKKYVRLLEEWIISTINYFGIECYRREGMVGIWTKVPSKVKSSDTNILEANLPMNTNRYVDAKIAAIGIRLRKWVSYHGIAINISNDLTKYSGIIACGISDYGSTSLNDLGYSISFEDFDKVLKDQFSKLFVENF